MASIESGPQVCSNDSVCAYVCSILRAKGLISVVCLFNWEWSAGGSPGIFELYLTIGSIGQKYQKAY